MRRHDAPTRVLAAATAAMAGYVDAVGYLHLRGFFVSFMSGNSTRLAVGAVGDRSAATIAGALVLLFVAGVVVGATASRFIDARRATVVLALVAALLALATALGWAGSGSLAIASMTLAMGVANAAFQRDGEVSIAVTYMTGALVKLGQRLTGAMFGEDATVWLWYLLSWLGLVAGAVVGADAYATFGLRAIAGAALGAVLLSVVAWRVERASAEDVFASASDDRMTNPVTDDPR